MKPELAEKIFALIQSQSEVQPTGTEFEMAYQGRVAIDRLRFAIKHTEQFGPHTNQMRDILFQLLDALQRLESADRRFQARSRVALDSRKDSARTAPNQDEIRSLNQENGRGRTQPRTTERAD